MVLRGQADTPSRGEAAPYLVVGGGAAWASHSRVVDNPLSTSKFCALFLEGSRGPDSANASVSTGPVWCPPFTAPHTRLWFPSRPARILYKELPIVWTCW